MKDGLAAGIVGKFLGARQGTYTPTEGRNAGKNYPYCQIALGPDEMTLDAEKLWFTTDNTQINETNIEKETKAYTGEKVKLDGVMVLRNFKPTFLVQTISLYKPK